MNRNARTVKTYIPSSPTRPSDSSFDKRFGIIAYTILLLIILLSTCLHHVRPGILRVPSNTDVSSWTSPSLEDTLLAEHLTEEERITLLTGGIPLGKSTAALAGADLFTILLGWLCFVHARRHYGFWMASCFLIGSFVFTGLEETLWILSGRFLGGLIHNPLGEMIYGSYWFTRGGLWFLETPIVACIGWFFIAYSCVLTAGRVFPRMNLWPRAVVGGLIAMIIDLWIDPVQTAPEILAWVWGKGDFLLLFGIPHYNFLGWFLLIAVFAVIWEYLPQWEKNIGRAGATNRFLLLILLLPFGILFTLWTWLTLFGNILSMLGIDSVLHIPAGW